MSISTSALPVCEEELVPSARPKGRGLAAWKGHSRPRRRVPVRAARSLWLGANGWGHTADGRSSSPRRLHKVEAGSSHKQAGSAVCAAKQGPADWRGVVRYDGGVLLHLTALGRVNGIISRVPALKGGGRRGRYRAIIIIISVRVLNVDILDSESQTIGDSEADARGRVNRLSPRDRNRQMGRASVGVLIDKLLQGEERVSKEMPAHSEHDGALVNKDNKGFLPVDGGVAQNIGMRQQQLVYANPNRSSHSEVGWQHKGQWHAGRSQQYQRSASCEGPFGLEQS